VANTTPTKASFFRAVGLCYVAIVDPATFSRLEDEDNQVLVSMPSPTTGEAAILKVRRTFAESLVWTLAATVAGVALGVAAACAGLSTKGSLAAVGGLGALVLLWATLAVRGWDIQTIGGVSLSERVNRWYVRGLSFAGTMLLTAAAMLGLWL
jgi:hypothetical protein